MENKKTAVEWLAEKIRFTNKELYAELQDEIEQAKVMESNSYRKNYNEGWKEGYDEGWDEGGDVPY